MNVSLINLILAFFWLAVAIGLFVLQKTGNEGLVPLPLHVLALVLALYNLVRWWSLRVAAAQRREGEQMFRKPSLRRASDDNVNPDPNFVFTEPPPGPAPSAGTDGITPEKK
jgi:hypothetical protein